MDQGLSANLPFLKTMYSINPHFPEEIWLRIFDWVTFVPYALYTDPPDAFAHPAQLAEEQVQEAIQQSLTTKRYLILVCKEWRVLATRYLYQNIMILRMSKIRKLGRTLMSQTAAGSLTTNGENPLGRWTLRFDVYLQQGYVYDRIGNSTWEALRDIFLSFSNLKILAFGGRGHANLLQETFNLASLAHPKLQKLVVLREFSSYSQFGTSIIPISFINMQPNLRVMIIQQGYWVPTDSISIPRIEYLDVPLKLLQPMSASILPAHPFIHLSIDKDNSAYGSLEEIGHCLTSLEIDDQRYNWGGRQSFVARLHDIARFCPNLQELVICLRNHNFIMDTDYLPPVARLGIRVHDEADRNLPDKRWVDFCTRLSSLVAKSDLIKVVRLLYTPVLHETEIYGRALKYLQDTSLELSSKFQVQFEDVDGCLLHERGSI